MNVIHTFDDKDPDEVLTLGIDFERLLDDAEEISSSTWAVELVTARADPDELELVNDPDLTDDPIVKHRVRGGTAGNTYKLKATVVTSQGRTIIGAAILPVRAA